MQILKTTRGTRGFAAALVLVFAVACGAEQSAVDVLVDAQEALRNARNAVLEASETLQGKEEALVVATEEVEESRAAVRTAQTSLVEIEGSVDLKATDGLLFRAIQRKLLDDGRLQNTAIRARVNKGVVTLVGEVPDGNAQEIALEIAREVPGVASVNSELTVAVSAEAL